MFQGRAYVDPKRADAGDGIGDGRDGNEFRRQQEDEALRIAEAWGAVPLPEAPEQLARDGEDYAVKVLTDQVAGGRYRLYIDCLATVRCSPATEPAGMASFGVPCGMAPPCCVRPLCGPTAAAQLPPQRCDERAPR